MDWTSDEKQVFDTYVSSELITPPRKLVGEYKFRLGSLATEITIRLYASFQNAKILFEQSHFIRTPLQLGPYETTRPWNDNISAALNQVTFGLIDHYNNAVKAGHTPDDSWLVANEEF
jgi:hypothetical protein